MPTKRKSRKSQTNQIDLYQQVTDKIVASIERGVLPWRKPWRDSKKTAESPILSNASTGNRSGHFEVYRYASESVDVCKTDGYQS